MLLQLSEQSSTEFYVLDCDYYQYAVLVCGSYPPEKGYHAVPVVHNDFTTISLLVDATKHTIAALKVAINAKTTQASCIHYIRY